MVVVPGLALLVLTAVAAVVVGVLLSGVAHRAAPGVGDVIRGFRGVTESDDLRVSTLVDDAAGWPGVEGVEGPGPVRRDFLESTISIDLDLTIREEVSRDELTVLALKVCEASAGLDPRDRLRTTLWAATARAAVSCSTPTHSEAIGAMLGDAFTRGDDAGLDWVALSIDSSDDGPPYVRVALWPTDPADGTRLAAEWSSTAASRGFVVSEAVVQRGPAPQPRTLRGAH